MHFSLLGLQVANLWSFFLVHFPTSPRTANLTWSNANRWPWRVGRGACVGGNRGWRTLWGNLSASASWSAAISSATSAGTVAWMGAQAFLNEVMHWENCSILQTGGSRFPKSRLVVYIASIANCSNKTLFCWKCLVALCSNFFYFYATECIKAFIPIYLLVICGACFHNRLVRKCAGCECENHVQVSPLVIRELVSAESLCGEASRGQPKYFYLEEKRPFLRGKGRRDRSLSSVTKLFLV